MPKIEIQARDFDLTPAIEAYTKEKLAKLWRYNKNIEKIRVWLFAGKERHSEKKFRAEGLVHLKGKIYLRGEEAGRSFQESIDLLSENLERQIKRHSHKK